MNSGDARLPSPLHVVEEARIAVAEPVRLRDYFLRLGANAEIAGTTVVVGLTEAQRHQTTIEQYLRAWVDGNGIPATIQPHTAPPAPPADAFGVSSRPRLGDLLISRGLITPQQLEAGLAESKATNQLLGRVLIERRHLFEDELARTLATQLDLPYVNLRIAGIDRGATSMMPASEGLRVGAIPIGYYSGRLRVAFADPSDRAAHDVVQRYVGSFDAAVAELSDIDLAWRSAERIPAYAGIS